VGHPGPDRALAFVLGNDRRGILRDRPTSAPALREVTLGAAGVAPHERTIVSPYAAHAAIDGPG
jgi:hypothetical protein